MKIQGACYCGDMSLASTETPRLAASAVRVGRRSHFYLVLPVLLIAIAFIGFWPQYYGRLLTGTPLDRGLIRPFI